MTQVQHADIVTLLTQQCQLIETAFIEEMTDRFVISIESRLAESLSFQQALELTVKDFGGRRNIQKMEWAYRLVFLKKQVGDWWALVKCQFSKQNLIRSVIVIGSVIVVSLYVCVTDGIQVNKLQISWFTLQCGGILPITGLTWFLLQHVFPGFKQVGVVRFPVLFRTILSYLLLASTLLLSFGLHALEMPTLLQVFSYSALWSTLAILYLAFVDYSMKTAPEQWYPTTITNR